MNRGSGGPPRRPKTSAKSHLPTGDFIALGPKGSRPPETELKPLQPPKLPQPVPPKKPAVTVIAERKRESTSPLTPTAKRPKLLASPPYSPLSSKPGELESKRPGTSTQSSPSHLTPIDVNPSDLERQVLEAESNGDRLRVQGLLLGSVRSLKANRNKPDPIAYLNLLYLAKHKPDLFGAPRIIEALTSILKRDISINIKTNKTTAALVPVMAANILLYIYQEEDEWPESFVKVYIEDSLGDRVWVDNEACQSFVDNILTAFGTKTTPRGITRQGSDPGSKGGAVETAAATPISQQPVSTSVITPTAGKEDEELLEEVEMSSSLEDDIIPVIPRFLATSVEQNISSYIMELVHDQLSRRTPVDSIPRNLLRVLTATCGYSQVRLLVSQRIEVWLQNPKLTRPAQELLMSLAQNCNSHSHEDVEVISNLIRMRLKTKPLANHYVTCIRELIGQHTENLGTVLKHVIYNELSTTRNPNNMSLLGMMYLHKPDTVAKLLAMVFQDLLANRDDYLRACRALLREVMRSLRYEVNCVVLCRGFMSERTESQFKDLDSPLKERMLISLTDLIAMTTMLSVTPAVKDVAAAFARGDKKDLSVLHQFQKNVSTIQRDAVWWLHTVVPKMFNLTAKEYNACLQKVLFLEPVENYSGKDNWPSEADKGLLYSLASDVPVQEDTLMRVVIIGLSAELPVTAPEALDIADRLTRRAASLKSGVTSLSVNRLELLDAVLNLCAYHYPNEIQLPAGYVPPKLAIANLYWKAWTLLAIVASLNPSSIGHAGWENFPMLKCMMEMILTNNFVFPPPTSAATGDERDQITAQDVQIAQLEKEDILEFETHLAAATTGVTITESNSLLLAQLTSMDPVGPARRPPQAVLDQLKTINKSLKLGQMLCRSRSPDFLLDIIQRQGASQSMPWLADLVQSSEGSLDVLPVQCLCEFLLMEKPRKAGKVGEGSKELDKKMNIQGHVLTRLRALLREEAATAESTAEVLEYFMRRLSSIVTAERNAATKGLEKVLSMEYFSEETQPPVLSVDTDAAMETTLEDLSSFPEVSGSKLKSSFSWLLIHLPNLPYFENVRSICCFALRQCCQVEIAPLRLQAYLVFLAEHTGGPLEMDFSDTLLEISQLVIERPTILNQVLSSSNSGEETHKAILGMYNTAILNAIEMQESSYFENDNQDQLFVQWSKDTVHAGKAATMHALVIQAAIVLLTWPPPTGEQSVYSVLLDTWCPHGGHVKVYLTDTGEEAVLLPEWLRLRMIRANVPRVVDAAVTELLPTQLVLFAQSFGIPVYSMSKLLQQLDLAAEEDPQGMSEAVLDKGYMLQLVAVQQLRGASGGDVFCALLTDEALTKPTGQELADEGRLSPLTVVPPVTPLTSKDEPMEMDEFASPDSLEELVTKCLRASTDGLRELRPVTSEIQKRLTQDVVSANKGVVLENNISDRLIEILLKLLNTDDGAGQAMFTNSGFFCGVFRLLMTRQTALKKQGKDCPLFIELVRRLLSHSSRGGPLLTALQSYSKQLGMLDRYTAESPQVILQSIAAGPEVNEERVREFLLVSKQQPIRASDLDRDMVLQAVSNLRMRGSHLLEEFTKALLKAYLLPHEPGEPADKPWSPKRSLTTKACADLLTSLLSTAPLSDGAHANLSSGLFVDWFEMVDPEFVGNSPLAQRQLLFSDRPCGSEGGSLTSGTERSAGAYLLASMTHQSRYDTLQDSLDWILAQDMNNTNLSPGAALDFLWTCFHIPRLWQGRDQKSCAIKAGVEGPVLSLASGQVSHMAGLLLAEVKNAVLLFCKKKGLDFKSLENSFLDPDSSDVKEQHRAEANELVGKMIRRRMPLLLLCCHGDDRQLQTTVDFLINTTRWPRWLTGQFLVHLYLAQPRIVTWVKDLSSLLSTDAYSKANFCQLDVMCHRVLTTLADCRPGREYEDKANNASLLCRKIAATHPMLLLRHLPMIAGLLRGRVHLNSKEFNSQQHLLFFSHMLGIMDLLRPHIFTRDKYIESGLRDALDVFIDLVEAPCLGAKELGGLATKLTEFLYNYCTSCAEHAHSLLKANGALLIDLLHKFPDLPPLKCLVSALSVPDAPDPAANAAGVGTVGLTKFRSMIMPLDVSGWTPAQLAPAHQKLAATQPLEEVLSVLVDLDETSKRKVDILQHFVPDLMRLMSDTNCACRTKAHTMALRHIRQNPREAHRFMNAFMTCLNSAEPQVVLTAAKFLPEFIILCNEHAGSLLYRLFFAAVYEGIDVGLPVSRTLQLMTE
ncbi:integrator complex subunit 1 [Nematostella vectensis]|uniref:integrator complex subunit 1 n=1 Tax=Nematostella vectensis TaxID=45351 RepID=UPI0020771C06|nr:integrator complex subunit 1 [Nematostella vectensis]